MNIRSIWLFIFIFSTLYILKIVYKFVKGVYGENLDITTREVLLFGLALSYFLTYII